MSSIARTLSAALLAGGALIAAGTTAANAGTCKGHSHPTAGSSSAIQYLASVSAKYAWKSAVASHDGGAYDTWGKAKNKSVTCKKSGPNQTWICTARGQPCN